MSENDLVPLYCPKCGESAMQVPANADPDSAFTCDNPKCGAKIRTGELKTASGKTIVEDAKDRIRDALKRIK